jgi:hypothetical protein
VVNPTRLELETPRFGEFARQHAAVSSADVRNALRLQSQNGGRIGAIMVELGYLTPEQVIDILRTQARWVARMRGHDLAAAARPFPQSASVSLCLPCYNEEQVIEDVLAGACAVLPEFLDEFEIVVVDDGSKDRTGAVVERFSRERDSRVRLIRLERNSGYGAAVAAGLRAAIGEWVFFTDGDGQFNFLDLPQLLVHVGKFDVVVGYRYNRADNALRRFNATGWKWLIRGTVGLQIRDLDCAFKIFRRRIIDRLQLDSKGACISAEIMTQCVRGGASIHEVPVNHYSRSVGKATGANFKVILKAFRELPVVWKYRRLKPWTWRPAPVDRADSPPVRTPTPDAVEIR